MLTYLLEVLWDSSVFVKAVCHEIEKLRPISSESLRKTILKNENIGLPYKTCIYWFYNQKEFKYIYNTDTQTLVWNMYSEFKHKFHVLGHRVIYILIALGKLFLTFFLSKRKCSVFSSALCFVLWKGLQAWICLFQEVCEDKKYLKVSIFKSIIRS